MYAGDEFYDDEVTSGALAQITAAFSDKEAKAQREADWLNELRCYRPPRCECGHVASSHRQDPVDPWANERCKTCGCAAFLNRDEAKMQSGSKSECGG